MTTLNEFDVLRKYLPFENNLSSYLCVKTKINTLDDLEFRVKTNVDSMVRKFGHPGWSEMRPLIVGIKCYTRGEQDASIMVRHSDQKNNNSTLLEFVEVKNEVWHPFKFPLLENYHTETRILMSNEVLAYTLAILDSSLRVRHDHGTNYFPAGYASFDTTLGGEYNKPLIYKNGETFINPSGATLESAIIVEPLKI